MRYALRHAQRTPPMKSGAACSERCRGGCMLHCCNQRAGELEAGPAVSARARSKGNPGRTPCAGAELRYLYAVSSLRRACCAD